MPVDKIKVQHKFGIISHNHRQSLLERIANPSNPAKPTQPPIPCEISHEFITSYNEADPLNREKLEVKASQLLQRVKRRAGVATGGAGKHVHIPRSWVELTLLARCKGPFRDDVLKVLHASLLTAQPNIENIPSLFLVCETVLEWIKEIGNPIPETAWSKTQILTYNITEICFWRVYNHALLHSLQASGSFLSDLSWHIENLDFIRKVYSKYPDGELLLRQLEAIKSVVREIHPSKKGPAPKTNFMSPGLMHGLDFYQSVRRGDDPAGSLSALLTTLSLLGTEDHLNTILCFKLLAIITSRNSLALQVIQAAATGKLPLSADATGVCKLPFAQWDWVTAAGFINLLVEVVLRGSTSEVQRSALKAGEMLSVRVDSAPVHGLGLLDLVKLSGEGGLSPAVQYALQQGLTQIHIHVQKDPLRKSAAHTIWTAIQTMKACPGHRVIVGIATNKSICTTDVLSQIQPNSKFFFEQMFDGLSDLYIPPQPSHATNTTSSSTAAPKLAKVVRKPPSITPPTTTPFAPTTSRISVLSNGSSRPSSTAELSPAPPRTYVVPDLEPYAARNDRLLRDVVADQWYKELVDVFRAAEKAHQSVRDCEEASEIGQHDPYSTHRNSQFSRQSHENVVNFTRKTEFGEYDGVVDRGGGGGVEYDRSYAEEVISELNLTESEVCGVMDKLVVKD